MPPHITDVHKPQRIRRRMFIGTASIPKDISDLNTGIFTIVWGRYIAQKTSRVAMMVVAMSMVRLDIYPPIKAPKNRPISIKNQ